MQAADGKFGPVAIFFHWSVAACVVCAVALGLIVSNFDESDLATPALSIHKSLGLTILGLACLRLVWRLMHRAPPLPSDIGVAQRVAAYVTHASLYMVLFALPITGYIAVAARGRETTFLGLIDVPRLTPLDRGLSRTAQEIHVWGQYVLYALLFAHIGATIYHHLVLKDNLLERMWPRRRKVDSAISTTTPVLVLIALLVFPVRHAVAVDWAKVPGKDVVLFYPAQMSWELLLTQSDHSGAKKFREGKDCRGCHDGEEKASGNLLVADKHSEPSPIAAKPGFINLNVKAARDSERLYIHLAFDPGLQPDAGMDKDFETKVAVMLDDGKVAEAGRAGCWAACHDNLTRMASGGDRETTKYLTRSRVSVSRQGGADIRPANELDKIRADGGYLEYWQARLKSDAAPEVVDGWILEKRQQNATPTVAAEATRTNGRWAVTLSRKLIAGTPYKDLVEGRIYTIGFSVHAGHAAHRFHYVSLERTLAIDSGQADFVAAR
jgi:cytochrome b561